jgi:hypothetical protein
MIPDSETREPGTRDPGKPRTGGLIELAKRRTAAAKLHAGNAEERR